MLCLTLHGVFDFARYFFNLAKRFAPAGKGKGKGKEKLPIINDALKAENPETYYDFGEEIGRYVFFNGTLIPAQCYSFRYSYTNFSNRFSMTPVLKVKRPVLSKDIGICFSLHFFRKLL